jgi:hypothetical protein
MMTSLTESGFFPQMISSFAASMPNATIGVKYTLAGDAKSNEIGSERIGKISQIGCLGETSDAEPKAVATNS